MPTIVDYPIVFQTLAARGLRCRHYNGGVFGWSTDVVVYHHGWLLNDDPTLTPAARQAAVIVRPPEVSILSHGLAELWRQNWPGPLWLMPGTHWAYELTHGVTENLAGLLNSVEIGLDLLLPRTDAAALRFEPIERASLELFVRNLLQMLAVTDFTIVFPEADVTVLLHHHRQLWWSTPSNVRNQAIRAMTKTLQ